MKNIREVTLQIKTNVSKDKVWDLLFNRFSEVNVFNPLIEGSHHLDGTEGEIGSVRQCDLDSKNFVHEKITAARGTESFDIDIIRGGLPMMDTMKGTFDLKALNSDQTKVTITMRFSTKPAFIGGLMKGMMAKMLMKMLAGLKFHLETGKEVSKENIKDIMKEFKNLKENEAYDDARELVLSA